MEIKVYEQLPVDAIEIRNEVFVKEQGFCEEFDELDKTALHLVGYKSGKSTATCRIINKNDDSYLIGRIAVRKENRGSGLGSEIIKAAEDIIKTNGGKEIYIHAQTRVIEFYQKLGYLPNGAPDEEEGCPHQMLIKKI